MNQISQFTAELEGSKLVVEVGKFVPHANGSCTVRYGDTMVLATVIMSEEAEEGVDYFPLRVEMCEKYYAAGKIKGSRYNKRESKSTEMSILDARMIDRGIRPLFPQEIRNNIQVVITILSIDRKHSHKIASILATSIALHISDIPWNGPIAGISIGQVDDQFIVNPTPHQQKLSDFNLTFSCSENKILMIDADAKEISYETMFKAFEFGLERAKALIQFIDQIHERVGKAKKDIETLAELAQLEGEIPLLQKKDTFEEAKLFFRPKLEQYLFNQPIGTKRERRKLASEMLEQLVDVLKDKATHEEIIEYIEKKFFKYLEAVVSRAILERNQRIDGRGLDQIRTLSCEVGLIPRTHGSAFFKRGETQLLSVVTLGSPEDEMSVESMDEEQKKRFIHHYNAHPFSFGEAAPSRGVARREVGHGYLAGKALLPVLPDKTFFPYTIRVVSEVMSSNGSTSMASTCSASLALMDAGVPIKRPVAGIAMGMASVGDTFKIITDLQDFEDGEGGMDFKITATEKGITAIQMDTKTDGLTLEICEKAMQQAEEAITEILLLMLESIPEPRTEVSKYAPRINTIKIDPEKIRDVIGPGGKVINEIKEATGTSIMIDQNGTVTVTGGDAKSTKEALKRIANLTREPEVGAVYDAKITRLMDFGAIAEFSPNKEGLIHISELQNQKVLNVTDIVNIGDVVKVKLIKIDEQGRYNLSMRALE